MFISMVIHVTANIQVLRGGGQPRRHLKLRSQAAAYFITTWSPRQVVAHPSAT